MAFMKTISSTHWPFVFLLALLTFFHLWGIPLVPFHPDESTQLFMSSDFETLFIQPASMAWDPAREEDLRQHYREFDAPLTRYTIGLGRWIRRLPALSVDWEWPKTWQGNSLAGALPEPQLLYTGRFMVTLLLEVSLVLIYCSGYHLGGYRMGLLAVLCLGTNALVLLHSRRAMAESALTMGIALAIWSFLQGEKRPWFAGAGIALAFNAKQSALALLPVGLVAVCWLSRGTTNPTRKIVRNVCVYLGVFGLITLALNPLLWSNPGGALRAAWAARNAWIEKSSMEKLLSGQIVTAMPQRTAVLLSNLYIRPLTFQEVDSYHTEASAAEAVYLRNPAHNLLRGSVGGGVHLYLTLLGLMLAIQQLRITDHDDRRMLSLLLLMTLAQAVALTLFVHLSWQRYVIPMVPFISLWEAYVVTTLFARIARHFEQS